MSGKKRSDRELQAQQVLLKRSEAVNAAVRCYEKTIAVQANLETARAQALERAAQRVQDRFQSKIDEAAADYAAAYAQVSALPWDPPEWETLGLPPVNGDAPRPRQRTSAPAKRRPKTSTSGAETSSADAETGRANAPADEQSAANETNATSAPTFSSDRR